MEPILDRRTSEILKEVVRSYIASGEPVGSRTISKLERFDLSAATVRNVLADLEEMGLVYQPHTSAGRVPTDQGYRYFVDALGRRRRPSRVEREQISQGIVQLAGEIKEMLQGVSHLLSQLSNQLGIVLGPSPAHVLFRRMEFLLVAPRKVLVVMLSPSGVVSNRLIDVEGGFTQEELDRVSRMLADRYEGWTLAAVRDDLLRLMGEERAACDRLLAEAVTLGASYFLGLASTAEIFFDGTANILGRPEFSPAQKVRSLLRAIEEKGKLVQLLNSCMVREGVTIVIGSESEIEAFGSCTLIASRLSHEGRVIGSLGILGPKRMEYARLIGLVESVAQEVSDLIGRSALTDLPPSGEPAPPVAHGER